MNVKSYSFKISAAITRLVIITLLAFSAFYPVYPWIPRLTMGVFFLSSLVLLLSAITIGGVFALTHYVNDDKVVAKGVTDEVVAANAKLVTFRSKLIFGFWVGVTTVLAYCGGFFVTGTVYFISALACRTLLVELGKYRVAARDRVLAEALA